MPFESVRFTPPAWAIKLLTLLETPSAKPRIFGLYHIAMLVLGALLVRFLCKRFKDAPDYTLRVIVGGVWLTLILLEGYKEVVCSLSVFGADMVFQYPFSIFPFQLCSTPFYVLPFVAFLPDSYLRRALMAYSATYALFGGLIVLFTPGTVFSTSLGMNIQTMVHHILQMAVGVYIAVHERYEMGRRHMAGGFAVFVWMLGIAVFLNERMHAYFVANGIKQSFNMFFVSPYYPGPIGFVNEWHAGMHPLLFVVLYALCFTVVSMLLCRVIQRLALWADQKERRALAHR